MLLCGQWQLLTLLSRVIPGKCLMRESQWPLLGLNK